MDAVKTAESASLVMDSNNAVDDSDHTNSRCDPHSPNFSYGEWITTLHGDPARRRKSDGGIAYQNLNVYGFGTTTDYQKTFANYPFGLLGKLFGRLRKSKIDILQDFEGLVESGEMLMVLGKPGSGCTTFLKGLAGQTHGFFVDAKSEMNYRGIPRDIMHNIFRGECTYQAESDTHFPHLTVKQTLSVAAGARAPANVGTRSSRKAYAEEIRNATIAALGLSGTTNVKVGNEVIRGVSGGERKRTSIAEVLVCGGSLQCWDNSTRGLDSANALNFARILRLTTRVTGSVAIVTMYQASQDVCNLFDKIVLLYEGQQIFFGSADVAKVYFTNLGFVCSERATTSDFLTSLTNPVERVVREGFESRVPRTPKEFAQIWKASSIRARLMDEIQIYGTTFPLGDENLRKLRISQKAREAPTQRVQSPYTISFREQVLLCITRGFQRLANDFTPPISSIAGNAILSIVLGSIFYNMPADTSSFFGRGVLLFFIVLTNTFLGAFEGVQLWDQRPIVEKHFQYALYHPSAEAIASMLCDIPNKLLLTTFFNVPFYFLANMRRDPGAFFTFYLFAFVSLVTGSMLFRTIGAMSKTLTSSIAPGATFILMLVIYTGFVLPIPSMRPWFRWFGYLDPVGYAFESLMINEFSGRQFSCARFVPQGPGYSQVSPSQKMCATVGAFPGSAEVDGDVYLAASFQYYPEHLWRNLGIIVGFMALLCGLYLLATEYISAQRSKGEVLIFRRGQAGNTKRRNDKEAQALNEQKTPHSSGRDGESRSGGDLVGMETRAANLLWDGLCYDVKVKDGSKRLLDDVEGWIKPGTLTALMGASGAGKTTLLNILANRSSAGVIGGEVLVDAKYQDDGFARKVGYAQQDDLHLATATVREALTFSARLRQSKQYSDAEKLAWVDEVIGTLDMSRFSEAVIGVPGEGLNVEQRKRVTIGVELAARPELLLFLDEPTSGLDSNTAWSICTLLRKLTDNGQAILCTIHQPSEVLFRMFNRLLFLVDGKTVYFGDVGPDSRILINYFEGHGARKCGVEENPAEWLLDVTSHAPDLKKEMTWPEAWHVSEERQDIKRTLEAMKKALTKEVAKDEDATSSEFATSFIRQLCVVARRNLEHDWRTPSYLYSKLFLTAGAGLINGFSFYHSENSLQGIQNQIFSVFLLFLLHSNLVQLVLPHFIVSRTLYETRERPSRTYSWIVFILSNLIAEIPWQSLLSMVQFVTWYYPIGMYRNALATDQLNERGWLMFLIIWSFLIFSSTFSQMLGTIMPDAATGVNISALFYSLSLIFCGVLVTSSALPRFWIFMYRATPVTYFVNAMVSTGAAGVDIVCSAKELVNIEPPRGQTCGAYLEEYLSFVGGRLLNPNAMQQCHFCPVANTDTLLAALGIHFEDRWRNFGITLAFTFGNVIIAICLYWTFRVPKQSWHNRRTIESPTAMS